MNNVTKKTNRKNIRFPTVTIAVSVYNEEENIIPFLGSVLMQKERGFVLEKIQIISDGSTDQTVKQVRKHKTELIDFTEGNHRLGKSTRLNTIYQSLTSDILVQTDADVIFSHPYVVAQLIMPFIRDRRVTLCGGHPQPIKGNTFTEDAINCTVAVYDELRREVRGGNNAFSADGRLLALRKEFAKRFTIPEDMIANDAFVYFYARSHGYTYAFIPSATVYYRSPKNLKDHIRQNVRFIAAPKRLARYFSQHLITAEYSVPRLLFWKLTAREFIKHPFHCLYIWCVNWYCRLFAAITERQLTAIWSIARSTKQIVSTV